MGFSGCRTLTSKMGQSQVTWNKSIILINLAHVGAEASFLKASILFYSTLRPHQRRWPLCEAQSPWIRKVVLPPEGLTWGLQHHSRPPRGGDWLLSPCHPLRTHSSFLTKLLAIFWSAIGPPHQKQWGQNFCCLSSYLEGEADTSHPVCSGEYGGAGWKPLAACLAYKCPTNARFTLLWISSKSIKEKKTTLLEETTSKWSFPKSLVFIFVSFFQWKLSVRIS